MSRKPVPLRDPSLWRLPAAIALILAVAFVIGPLLNLIP